MREDDMDSAVHQKILEISQLPSTAGVAGDYGNVRYLAQQSHGLLFRTVGEKSSGRYMLFFDMLIDRCILIATVYLDY